MIGRRHAGRVNGFRHHDATRRGYDAVAEQLISRDDFPQPDAVLAMGKVWRKDDVIAWAKAHGRLGDG